MPNVNFKRDYRNESYKTSGNPNFRKKKHSLIIDSQGASEGAIKTESGTLNFESGIAMLPDDSRAEDMHAEITAKYANHPGHFALVQDKPTANVDRTHRYFFGSWPDMPKQRRPSDRWEEFAPKRWRLKRR